MVKKRKSKRPPQTEVRKFNNIKDSSRGNLLQMEKSTEEIKNGVVIIIQEVPMGLFETKPKQAIKGIKNVQKRN